MPRRSSRHPSTLPPSFAGRIQENAPLAHRTTLRLGGPARWLAEPRDTAELVRVLRHFGERGIPTFLLGGGANVIVPDEGIDGAVIALGRMRRLVSSRDHLVAEAGVRLEALVARGVREGRAGFEHLVGIPGTVGGSVQGNAGGPHGTISTLVERVFCVDRHGAVHAFRADAVGFDYRRSGLDGLVVAEVVFQARQGDAAPLVLRCRDILIAKKRSQPLEAASAGCVFRNPPGDAAGRLIDAAGLKGLQAGGCQVSVRHANFILNLGGGTARDYFTLAREVQQRVHLETGVRLEMEVQVLGRPGISLERAA